MLFIQSIAFFFFTLTLALAAPHPEDSASAVGAGEFSGDLTYYYPAGGYGACGSILNDYDAVVALSVAQYDVIGCGACLQVYGPLGTVKVTVADKCMGCKHGDVDLAYGAFVQIADEAAGRLPVTWSVVPC